MCKALPVSWAGPCFFVPNPRHYALAFPGLPAMVTRGFRVRKSGLKLVLTGLVMGVAISALPLLAKEARLEPSGSEVSVGSLPPQAQTTYRLVLQGGPFPFAKDGVTFSNRERLLPLQTRGYYREYTVKTPWSSDRGARRIVCGGPVTVPVACYYTADHYASFRKIVP
jgi:ribonuclease T1